MSTGLLGSHVHKQRMLNKYDQLGSPQLQPPQQQQQHNLNSFPPHPQQQQAPPQSRLQSHFAQNQPIADDDLGKKHPVHVWEIFYAKWIWRNLLKFAWNSNSNN